ncbi:MAG: macro domain-containing protein [Candidatus Eisenbacteria bacterium]
MSLDDHLRIVQGDITTFDVDVIVNAANVALMAGGGVCGAIHRAAGPELAESCREVAPCPTGEARLTPGYLLKARYVIHAVGPVWMGGKCGEDQLLSSCYRAALALAERHQLATMAFPAISTGIFRFPLERATALALQEIQLALARAQYIKQVTCVCFDEITLDMYTVMGARLAR